jgi:predicted methyltransferase
MRTLEKLVESLYQQFHDLIEEYIKIKVAIDKANSETFIHVAGKRMSLREALMYKQRDGITHYMRGMVTAYNQSVAQAMRVVHTHNSQFNSIPEDSRTPFLADIESMVNRERIVELDEFLVKFTSEVDGELDDAIISTPITID